MYAIRYHHPQGSPLGFGRFPSYHVAADALQDHYLVCDSWKLARPKCDVVRVCDGKSDRFGAPCCLGEDILTVSVLLDRASSRVEAVVDWCIECRTWAQINGVRITVVAGESDDEDAPKCEECARPVTRGMTVLFAPFCSASCQIANRHWSLPEDGPIAEPIGRA